MIFFFFYPLLQNRYSPATGCLGLIEKWSLLPVNSTPLQRESFSNRGHAGIRTQGPILKRDVLYRLSYVTSGTYMLVLPKSFPAYRFCVRVSPERAAKVDIFLKTAKFSSKVVFCGASPMADDWFSGHRRQNVFEAEV